MPRKPCYWTRKLELDLVEFVRQKEFIWRPIGNTNHHIQQKYKAYAEFAAKLGRGFTARSVRDRWVNIRSTFNHNLRRVDKSRETAVSSADIYVPCWPLWQPLQFLREVSKKEETNFETYQSLPSFDKLPSVELKNELQSEIEIPSLLIVRQRGHRTDRPRQKQKPIQNKVKENKCKKVLDDLVQAMRPLVDGPSLNEGNYWFFGKHVTERLNSMQDDDAECASKDIMQLLALSYGGFHVKEENNIDIEIPSVDSNLNLT